MAIGKQELQSKVLRVKKMQSGQELKLDSQGLIAEIINNSVKLK